MSTTRLSKTEELAARLYFEEGLRPKEIAQRLGISVSTVYKAISKYRALKKVEGDGETGERQEGVQQRGEYHKPSESTETRTVMTFNFIIPSASNTPIHGVLHESIIVEREMLGELRRIRELLMRIVEEIQTLKTTLKAQLTATHAKPEKPQLEVKAELPDFVRDNPWIDVIRSIKAK